MLTVDAIDGQLKAWCVVDPKPAQLALIGGKHDDSVASGGLPTNLSSMLMVDAIDVATEGRVVGP